MKNTRLMSEVLLPITLRLEFEKRDDHDRPRVKFVQCHAYGFSGTGTVDLRIVDAGRLRYSSSYNGILMVEEVDESEME